MRYGNLTLLAALVSVCAIGELQARVAKQAPKKEHGVQVKDVRRVLEHKDVEYAYVRPEVVELVEKMAPGVCKCCPEVCALYEQVCAGFRTAPYDLVETAVCKMIDRCPDEVSRACLKKYAQDLRDKSVLIVVKEARAPQNVPTRVLPDCDPQAMCDLVPPVFGDFDCPTPADAAPIPPTPADQNPLVAPTAVAECVLPDDGVVVLCDIEVGSITADEICTETLAVEENINVSGSLIANENVSAQGDVIAGDRLSAGGDIIGGADLQLTGTIYANGDLNVGGSGFIGGDLDVLGDIIAGGQVIFSGAIVTDDLCAQNLQAQTAILGNTKLCEVVLENLYVSGLVQFALGTGAFCGTYPAKQGYGEIYFTARDLVFIDCPDKFVDNTGCFSTIPGLYAARYDYVDDSGSANTEDYVFGARLENYPDGGGSVSLPHVDFAIPGDALLDPNCTVEVDVHLVAVNGTTQKNIDVALVVLRSSGVCGAGAPLDDESDDVTEPCTIPTVTDPVRPQHLRLRFAPTLGSFDNFGSVAPGDWVRLAFTVPLPSGGQLNLAENDCVLINSVVVRYPRVDAFEAMLPCNPPAP